MTENRLENLQWTWKEPRDLWDELEKAKWVQEIKERMKTPIECDKAQEISEDKSEQRAETSFRKVTSEMKKCNNFDMVQEIIEENHEHKAKIASKLSGEGKSQRSFEDEH